MSSEPDHFDEEALSFMAVTGASMETATQYLEFAQGNIEQAVTLYMEGQEPQREPQPHKKPRSAGTGIPDMDVREPIGPTRGTLVGPNPFDFQQSSQAQIRRTSNPFDQSSRYTDFGGSSRHQSHGFEGGHHDFEGGPSGFTPDFEGTPSGFDFAIQGTRMAIQKEEPKLDKIDKLFLPPYDLMFQGSFEAAREAAKSTKKLLMITITDKTQFPSLLPNRDLWKDTSVKESVKALFIFQQFDIKSEQGQAHRNWYPYELYPYIAVIDPMTGERIKLWKSNLKPSDFILEVMDFSDRYGQQNLPIVKHAAKVPVSELSEEDQMRLAIEASMGIIAAADEPTMDEEIVILNELPLDVIFKKIQAKSIPESTLPSSETARVQFKFPDGSNLVFKFSKSDTIRTLFEVLKFVKPEYKPFELTMFREPLLKRLDETLGDAKIANTSLVLDFLK